MGSLSLLSRPAPGPSILCREHDYRVRPPVFHLQVQVGHTARDFPVRHTTAKMRGFEGLSSA